MSTTTSGTVRMSPCACGRYGAHSCNGHRIAPVQVALPISKTQPRDSQ